jgi:hypothetical protein
VSQKATASRAGHGERSPRLPKLLGPALRKVRRVGIHPAVSVGHPKPMPNWCPQVNPDEAWTARCVKEKIAADGKRHRCQKKVGHDDNVHTCKCGLEWKQW